METAENPLNFMKFTFLRQSHVKFLSLMIVGGSTRLYLNIHSDRPLEIILEQSTPLKDSGENAHEGKKTLKVFIVWM